MEGREFSYKDSETMEVVFQKRRRCFCFPCFGSSNRGGVGLRWWHKGSAEVEEETSFFSRGIGALKKLREWSEIVAGPRWKTFIRRFNRTKSGSGGRQGKFQYDPLSYSLNFDQGPVPNEEEEEENEYIYRNFSTRYASVLASMDLGKDGPSFV